MPSSATPPTRCSRSGTERRCTPTTPRGSNPRREPGTRAFDGILGSHLDAAYRLRRELGRDDDETRALGIAAGERLGAAAVRSSRLSGSVRDANALERAAELLPKGHETRAQALVESAFVLSGVGGDLDAVAAAFERAEEEAGAAGRRDLELLADFWAAVVRLDWDGVDHASLATAITELETAGADEQVAHLHFIAFRGRPDDADARTHLAAAWRFAESSGSDGIGGQTIDSTAAQHARAATRLSDVFAWLDGLEPRTRERPSLEAARLSALGGFLAAAGRIDEARATAAEGRVLRAELGQRRHLLARSAHTQGFIEQVAGGWEAAQRFYREEQAFLAHLTDDVRAACVARIANCLCEQGRLHEADELARSSSLAGGTRGRILARAGRFDEAEATAREAARRWEPWAAEGYWVSLDLAEVMALAGKTTEARRLVTDVIEQFERGEAWGLAAQTRIRLEQLDGAVATGTPNPAAAESA